MNIYEKILAIMQEVRYLAKDDRVQFGTTDYKALSEEKVTGILREKLLAYKLIVYPVQQQASRNGQISHVDVVYKMVNVENPEEQIEIASCGDGADSQDKGSGKAMTYAFKYMWLRTFALPTGEDPDQIASAELDAAFAPVCESCGNGIAPVYKKDGTLWETAEMVQYSRRRFGKALCDRCMKAGFKKEKKDETA